MEQLSFQRISCHRNNYCSYFRGTRFQVKRNRSLPKIDRRKHRGNIRHLKRLCRSYYQHSIIIITSTVPVSQSVIKTSCVLTTTRKLCHCFEMLLFFWSLVEIICLKLKCYLQIRQIGKLSWNSPKTVTMVEGPPVSGVFLHPPRFIRISAISP